MDLMTVFQRFPDHGACIEHLERVRWPHTPACPHCGAVNVGRKADGDRIGRWNCHACHSSYNVLSGTIFEKTRIELQKWFLAISIIYNAKNSVSSHQLARDLDLNQKTAWYMAIRIRRAMVVEWPLLAGILEADEAYIGGKPRKPNKMSDDKRGHGGRGTDKMPITGAVERGGRLVAEPSPHINVQSLKTFLNRNVAMREACWSPKIGRATETWANTPSTRPLKVLYTRIPLKASGSYLSGHDMGHITTTQRSSPRTSNGFESFIRSTMAVLT